MNRAREKKSLGAVFSHFNVTFYYMMDKMQSVKVMAQKL